MSKKRLDIINSTEASLRKTKMPERRSLDDLQDAVDILLGEGIMKMRLAINSDLTPVREQISAVNTVVTIGKYVHTRKIDEATSDNSIEIDEELRI